MFIAVRSRLFKQVAIAVLPGKVAEGTRPSQYRERSERIGIQVTPDSVSESRAHKEILSDKFRGWSMVPLTAFAVL